MRIIFKTHIVFIFVVGLFFACKVFAHDEYAEMAPISKNADASVEESNQLFHPDWKSLKQYRAPAWFRDAKFGIFLHWGVFSVPEYDCWYARHMYMQESAAGGDAVYQYHLAHYGHPSQFGFKDLIPLWKAEHWDPDALVELFRQAGAKYVVPVAVHHDNFDNYDSTYQPWNSVGMGPHRDIIGEWKKAVEKRGLRFGVSSHNDRAWQWLNPSHGSDSHGQMKGVPYDGNLTKADGKGKWWEGYDPQDLYCRPHGDPRLPDSNYMQKGDIPDAAFQLNWYHRTRELIDKYQPDLVWFDGPIPLGDYGLRIAAHFYNSNIQRHNGQLEAVLNIKSWGPGTITDDNAIVLDVEKGLVDSIRPNPWQTDTSIPPDWIYTPQPPVLSDTVIIHNLCDIVSKNGNLLLNVGLRPDGSLPENQKQTLLNIGKWLSLNGEAIYSTKPWKIFGEGPTKVVSGDFKENTKPLTAQDVRFTTRNKVLYAIIMGWPGNGKVTLHSLPTNGKLWPGKITAVEMIGVSAPLNWQQDTNGLVIQTPQQPPCDYAYVFRIRGDQ